MCNVEKSNNYDGNEELTMNSKLYLSGYHIALARNAYRKYLKETSDHPAKYQALVAIVFAAASLEAFINELTEAALRRYSESPESIQSFATLLNEVEESRGSTRLKFQLGWAILTGKPYDKGKPPYQDFSNLLKLRDQIMHLKPQNATEFTSVDDLVDKESFKLVSGLPKNLLADDDNPGNWIEAINTQAVARWACNTACEMVASILDALPEGRFKEELSKSYKNRFVPEK